MRSPPTLPAPQNLKRAHDLKTYHKSESKAVVKSSKLKQTFGDIGLEWGLRKCAAVNIKRGKIAQE